MIQTQSIMDKNIKLNLVSGLPIKFENSLIYQPTIKTIIENLGEDDFSNILIPFAINTSIIAEFEQVDKVKNFDLFFIQADGLKMNNMNLLELLIKGIKFLFKTSNVQLYRIGSNANIFSEDDSLIPKIIIDNCTKIDRYNFDNLADIVLLMTHRERLKPEQQKESNVVVGMSEDAKARFAAFQEGKKEYEKKQQKNIEEKTSLANMAFAIETAKAITLDYENISVYKLIQSYRAVLNLEAYNHKMNILSSGMVSGKDIDTTHWTDLIKI